MNPMHKDRWEQGFAALCKFRRRKGHCCPPKRHVEGKYNLGRWVITQRYRKAFLSVKRKRRLDKIGFVWNWREFAWEQGFAALLNFKRREGHCRVPIFHSERKYRLGSWVSVQRRNRQKLSRERKARLNKIDFLWKANRGGKAHRDYKAHKQKSRAAGSGAHYSRGNSHKIKTDHDNIAIESNQGHGTAG